MVAYAIVLAQLGVLAGLLITEGVAQSSVKMASVHNGSWPSWKVAVSMLVGIIAYTALLFILLKAYSSMSMGRLNAIWSAMSVLTIVLIGVFAFGEKHTTTEWIGIGTISLGLGVLAVYSFIHPEEIVDVDTKDRPAFEKWVAEKLSPQKIKSETSYP
jgi:multidrug transporter EmrE-like cation transporter